MSKNYEVRKLYKEDIPAIKTAYKKYENLHYTPINDKGIWQILVCGSFWGVFLDGRLLSVTYAVPWESRFMDNTDTKWELEDLLGESCNHRLICGYIGGILDNSDINRAICWLWHLQALTDRAERLVYCSPACFYTDFKCMFDAGFLLSGLRGLQGLVPHYIFEKCTDFSLSAPHFSPQKSCSVKNTKEVSKLCEKGYRGYDIENDNILFIEGGPTLE